MFGKFVAPAALALVAPAFAGCISLGLYGAVPEMEERLIEDHDADRKVALIDVVGELALEKSGLGPLGGAADNIVGRTKEQLDLAAEDDAVCAVVVRISSPGGEVYPSLEIHRELVRFRQRTGKPVVAYVPDVAASGGYLAALGAEEIVADESALTGSIGVLLLVPELSGLLELVRVKVNVVKAGERKDLGSPFREMTDDDRAELMKLADYYHQRFKIFVDASRSGLDAAGVDELADGRVFNAPEALANGLVDAVGDLAVAHAHAAGRAGLTADTTNLVMYRRPSHYGHNAFAMGAPPAGGMQINLDVGAMLPRPQVLFLWQP